MAGYILGFDTSAAHCAAAVLSGDRLVTTQVELMDKGQAERLMPMLEEVLAGAGIGWRDLAAIGVGVGPGNFTGIRISVAAARGLALALGIPAIGVSAFEALGFGLRPVLASVDARRGAVYLLAPGGEPVMAGALPDGLAGSGLAVVGHRAAEFAALTGGAVPVVLPVAEAIARVALVRRVSPQPRPAPLYLRSADAAPPSDPPPVMLS